MAEETKTPVEKTEEQKLIEIAKAVAAGFDWNKFTTLAQQKIVEALAEAVPEESWRALIAKQVLTLLQPTTKGQPSPLELHVSQYVMKIMKARAEAVIDELPYLHDRSFTDALVQKIAKGVSEGAFEYLVKEMTAKVIATLKQ